MNAQPSTSTISGSASCQTHLSTTNSQQRLRATTSYTVVAKESTVSSTAVLSSPNSLTTALRALLPLDHHQDHHRSWKGLAFKWLALVYCFLSLIFLSTALYKHICLPVHDVPASPPLQFLSAEQRLSRIPGLRMLDPYLLPGSRPKDNTAITACLWTTDSEDSLLSLAPWASNWQGPISLVVVTMQTPRSTSHHQLIEQLRNLQRYPSLSSLSLHLVHTAENHHPPSTAYLNIARLFAVSPTVMLFPANLSNIPPPSFYATLVSRRPNRKPVLVTGATSPSAFSIPPLTPVVLPRNYPAWCTERAFLPSRVAEYDDCLWQLWLEEYGLGQVNITVKLDAEEGAGPAATRLRNRLSGRYRVETCDLAMKRLDPPGTSKNLRRRLQWVKSFCRQVGSHVCILEYLLNSMQTENAIKNSSP
ncbi:hypothetical protein FB45DRAFT_821925 [Roridomyces roridus]|uniref:Uncharacterized protein n=1 Tax=Roridomyces roridus TaxID=1738132 RepID=A0AAD7CFI9_9AGAR|nr:hypothetical protein FB45DRAFT_821925 [Roridomyces roridus]